ncbi:hypothetical protein KIN20_032275 [Parelaphostrongylus tenuis]|uniref:LIM zinc-binding domain-containing protein n=1 Tax=Parelaphostrongylus tenuis TaxID=148309 RepID=A0AAD5WID8_PARTN|nr:hypothetical protein KIN20_032275 [Parelaphostrongylus tenuis]
MQFTQFKGVLISCFPEPFSVESQAVVAMNRLWHPDHFTCTACKRPIKQTYQVVWRLWWTRVSWLWIVTGILVALHALPVIGCYLMEDTI